MGKVMRILFFTAVAMLAACIPHTNAVDTGNKAHPDRSTRIIIGFSDPGFDYQDPEFLEILSQKLAAEVTFLRPLSGNAALYVCEPRDPEDVFTSRLSRLAQLPGIDYAEPDQKRKTQN